MNCGVVVVLPCPAQFPFVSGEFHQSRGGNSAEPNSKVICLASPILGEPVVVSSMKQEMQEPVGCLNIMLANNNLLIG